MSVAQPDIGANGVGRGKARGPARASRRGGRAGWRGGLAASSRHLLILDSARRWILVLLVVAPMLRLLVSSFQSTDSGAFTLAKYVDAYASQRRLIGLGNSLLYGAAVVRRFDLLRRADRLGRRAHRHAGQGRGARDDPRRLHHAALSRARSAGFLLGGPNAGWINRAWMWLTGDTGPLFNVYSFAGLVLVTALYSFPYIFVFTADALDRVSSEMEEAANILGMSPLRTIFKVTLPLVLLP